MRRSIPLVALAMSLTLLGLVIQWEPGTTTTQAPTRSHTSASSTTSVPLTTAPTSTLPSVTTTTEPSTTVPVAITSRVLAPRTLDGGTWTPNDGTGVTWTEFVAWSRVGVCEEGGNWHADGPTYSGIGFLNSSWLAYGGGQFAPRAGLATPDEQIVIGDRITGGWVPDQRGCAPW